MAVNYRLEFDTSLLAEAALALIEKTFSFKRRSVDNLAWPPNSEDAAITIYASNFTGGDDYYAKVQREIMEEGFGFMPTLAVIFRLRRAHVSYADYDEAEHLKYRAVMLLLQQSPGDAVFLFNGEEIVLQRLKGQLTLNMDWGQWDSANFDYLNEITLPHDIRNLPSPLL